MDNDPKAELLEEAKNILVHQTMGTLGKENFDGACDFIAFYAAFLHDPNASEEMGNYLLKKANGLINAVNWEMFPDVAFDNAMMWSMKYSELGLDEEE